MAAANIGRLDWSTQATREGHRTHTIKWLVRSALSDGPFDIYFAAGLPQVGATWVYGAASDDWAFCEPDWVITPVINGEPNTLWTVEQKFSTVPRKRCQDVSIEDPLSEPDRLSGSFVKYTTEARRDSDGLPLVSSSFERITGKIVEKDENRPTVRIEQNVATLDLALFCDMVDKVNDATLWGLAARKVKLSNANWARKLQGVCNYYFTLGYDFDINFQTFDRKALDEGTKRLREGGDKDVKEDWIEATDTSGGRVDVIYDINGDEWDPDNVVATGEIELKLYEEANFLLLGIPSDLNDA